MQFYEAPTPNDEEKPSEPIPAETEAQVPKDRAAAKKAISGGFDDELVVVLGVETNIDSVFGMCTVAQPSDIHTGACAYMFHVTQVADVVVSVLYCIVVVYRYQFVLFHSCFFILSL